MTKGVFCSDYPLIHPCLVFFAPPLIHGRCFCCLRVRAAAVAGASYNWVWFPRWSIHPSHYAGNKKFMFDNDQNHCDNDNEIIWFPFGNTDTDMLRLPLLIIIEIFNYLFQQLTLEVEMNVSNSIHISFRVGHFSSCRHVQHEYTSLSQSVLIYYTVLIHYYPLWPGTHHSSFDTMTYWVSGVFTQDKSLTEPGTDKIRRVLIANCSS